MSMLPVRTMAMQQQASEMQTIIGRLYNPQWNRGPWWFGTTTQNQIARGMKGLGRYTFDYTADPRTVDPTDPCSYVGISVVGVDNYCAFQDALRPAGTTKDEWMAMKPGSDPLRQIDQCTCYPIEIGPGANSGWVAPGVPKDGFNVQVFRAVMGTQEYFLGDTVTVTARRTDGAGGFTKSIGTLASMPGYVIFPVSPADYAPGNWQLFFTVGGCSVKKSVFFRVSTAPCPQLYSQGITGPADSQCTDATGHYVPCTTGGSAGGSTGGSGSGSGGSGSGSGGGGSTGGSGSGGNAGNTGSTGDGTGGANTGNILGSLTQNQLLIGGAALLALVLIGGRR